MKLFTITKTGYSSGTYGCTDEYYTYIVINGEETTGGWFKGLYGEDYRVKEKIEKLGYKFFHTNSAYGKIPQREYKADFFDTSDEIVEKVKEFSE